MLPGRARMREEAALADVGRRDDSGMRQSLSVQFQSSVISERIVASVIIKTRAPHCRQTDKRQ